MVTENDDASKSKEARPPTLEDLLGLCRSLNEKQAKYIVIGGLCIAQHGFVRATEDIDLLIEKSLANEKLVIEALGKLPDQAALEIKPGEIAQYEVIRVADEIVVDLMTKACGMEYPEASKQILEVKIKDVVIPFASIDLMILLKKSIRPKDKMDLEFLQNLRRSSSKGG